MLEPSVLSIHKSKGSKHQKTPLTSCFSFHFTFKILHFFEFPIFKGPLCTFTSPTTKISEAPTSLYTFSAIIERLFTFMETPTMLKSINQSINNISIAKRNSQLLPFTVLPVMLHTIYMLHLFLALGQKKEREKNDTCIE